MNEYFECLRKYADFSGRARRKEFWMFTLVNFIIVLALLIIESKGYVRIVSGKDQSILAMVYCLFTSIPSLAVFVRRLHDTNRSGRCYFIGWIPIIGSIILLLFVLQDSDPGPNQYGVNPKR
jgi:uncharacterized membrane protein YhaH (DUF805 family)